MSLEVKIPPPVVTVATAAIMWGISRLLPGIALSTDIRWAAALALAVAGLAIGIAGVMSFRRARTTTNPTQPDKASALVCAGIYRFTRNPMYLGLVFILVAWAVFLSSAWALLGVAGFVLYMSRFQIAPEERALSRIFGGEYDAYTTRVRRWL